MDLKLHRPNGCCVHTDRAFVPGEVFYSALVRKKGTLERIDCSVAAWTGPPEHTLAWWQSTHTANAAGGATLAPVEVLLDVLEQLDGRPEDAALRYLLALELVRRRVLRVVDRHTANKRETAEAAEALLLACRRRDSEYRVPVLPPHAAAAEGVQERLMSLLWSGGAA